MTREDRGNSERRRYRRVKVPMYFRDARRRDRKKPIVDIGLGGLRVYSDEPLEIGKRHTIEIGLEDGRSLTGLVETAWIEDLGEAGPARYDVGLRLVATDPDDLKQLKALIDAASQASDDE